MSYDGGHLGFPIVIKSIKFVEDLPMIIPGQFGFNCPSGFKAKLHMNVHWMVLYKLYVFCSDMKFKMAATAGLSLTLDPMGKMFQNASIGTKNVKFVEDHPMNIHVQFGFNNICSF
jgi:hypothetical protein